MTTPATAGPAKEGGFFERNPWAPYACVIFAVVFGSSSFIVGRYLREDILPMGFVFWRSLVVIAVIAALFAPKLRAQLPLLMRHWKLMMALGFTYAVIGTGVLYYGLQTTTALNAGFIAATQPILMFLLAWLTLGDSITWRQGLGVVVAFAGVLAIVCQGNIEALLTLALVVGDFWVQLSILSWSVYAVMVKKYAPTELHPFVLLWGATAAAALLTLPLYGIEMGLGGAMAFDWITVAFIVFTASLMGALAAWNIGLTYIGPGMTGMFTNLAPVATALMAIGLLGEVFESYHAVGMVLVFGGIYLTTVTRRALRRRG